MARSWMGDRARCLAMNTHFGNFEKGLNLDGWPSRIALIIETKLINFSNTFHRAGNIPMNCSGDWTNQDSRCYSCMQKSPLCDPWPWPSLCNRPGYWIRDVIEGGCPPPNIAHKPTDQSCSNSISGIPLQISPSYFFFRFRATLKIKGSSHKKK